MRCARRVFSVGLSLVLLGSGCSGSFAPQRSSTTTQSAAPPGPRSVIVAVDGVGVGDGGFNPHLVADLSQVTAAVASLTLPSPFRPAADPSAPGGVAWNLDRSFLAAADVVGHAPFTVRYRVRGEAQWSDGAPIAAEDFQYLWRQMTTQPGVADAGGYGLIDEIRSGAGGKEVTVVFRDEYPRWKELFADLLPAHVGRDDLGGFPRAFQNGITVAGASFRVEHMDRNKEEVELVRNDRYWDSPAWADKILLRRMGSGTQLAAALRNKEAQLVLVHGSASVLAQLQAVPQVRAEVRAGQAALSLILNARDARLRDQEARQALLGVLDQGLLARIGAQDAVALPPGGVDPPERVLPDQAREKLVQLGYAPLPERTPSGPAPGAPLILGKDGRPLAMSIGVAQNDARAFAVASTAADQWRSIGVAASVVQLAPEELYGAALRDNKVQAIVGWSAAGGDLATSLYSRYACPDNPGGASLSDPQAPVDPVGLGGVRNLAGVCAPELQTDFLRALSGKFSGADLQAEVIARFTPLAVELPLMRDAGLFAVGPGISGVAFGGPSSVGPMAGAAGWELH
ncbi:extracellular solute-binding protein family 5 [Segniliparus rotundus DSM 44985]|uniref:Extracellular solute-binding protein family 5 n=1 Tax=Segniliparus rotundus (strain ATCC BAA-972 / CDC 1076 / CIP 108378 / DSM 44985 / JCM 13578) TaxID=640132 RepID=D6ZE31_SEGRD|nr:ABC transporter family substrate-binding protein [Segniliparus rotundus]ADG97311.1 extracellular solute-binding protein family 5 [Segniliparus rotundus DSM 44985]